MNIYLRGALKFLYRCRLITGLNILNLCCGILATLLALNFFQVNLLLNARNWFDIPAGISAAVAGLASLYNYFFVNIGLNVNRLKEIRIRKMAGAKNLQIFTPILIENLIQIGLALILSIVAIDIISGVVEPYFTVRRLIDLKPLAYFSIIGPAWIALSSLVSGLTVHLLLDLDSAENYTSSLFRALARLSKFIFGAVLACATLAATIVAVSIHHSDGAFPAVFIISFIVVLITYNSLIIFLLFEIVWNYKSILIKIHAGALPKDIIRKILIRFYSIAAFSIVPALLYLFFFRGNMAAVPYLFVAFIGFIGAFYGSLWWIVKSFGSYLIYRERDSYELFKMCVML